MTTAGTPRRRYTRRDKITTILAAEMTSAAAVHAKTGIPERTIRSWLDRPAYAELRAKTRDALADEARVIQQLAAAEITRRLPEFEPRDLTILYGVMADKGQLLSGNATERVETLTSGLDDHERAQLHDVLRRVIAEREVLV